MDETTVRHGAGYTVPTNLDDVGEGTVTHVAEFGRDHIFFNGPDPVAWITVQDRPEQPERPEPAQPGDPLW